MNFITIRRATVRCILAAVDKSQIPLYWLYNKRKIEWRSGIYEYSFKEEP
jgi:hypothetical protein